MADSTENSDLKTELRSELNTAELTVKEKLVSETALISWLELQRFFAQGSVMWVAEQIDLVATAAFLAEDQSEELTPLLESSQIAPVSNDQAKQWYASKTVLWCVVVAPFVLVQEPKNKP